MPTRRTCAGLLAMALAGTLLGAGESRRRDRFPRPEHRPFAVRRACSTRRPSKCASTWRRNTTFTANASRSNSTAREPQLGTVTIPAGQHPVRRPTSRRMSRFFEGAVVLRVPLASANRDFRLRVSYQGCADEGLCYPPQTASVAASVERRADRAARPGWAKAASASAVAAMAKETPPAIRCGARGVRAEVGKPARPSPRCSSSPGCCCPSRPACCRWCRSCRRSSSARVRRCRADAASRWHWPTRWAWRWSTPRSAWSPGCSARASPRRCRTPGCWGPSRLLLAAAVAVDVRCLRIADAGLHPESPQPRPRAACRAASFAGVFVMGGLSALIVGPCVAAPLAGALVFISQTKDVVHRRLGAVLPGHGHERAVAAGRSVRRLAAAAGWRLDGGREDLLRGDAAGGGTVDGVAGAAGLGADARHRCRAADRRGLPEAVRPPGRARRRGGNASRVARRWCSPCSDTTQVVGALSGGERPAAAAAPPGTRR